MTRGWVPDAAGNEYAAEIAAANEGVMSVLGLAPVLHERGSIRVKP